MKIRNLFYRVGTVIMLVAVLLALVAVGGIAVASMDDADVTYTGCLRRDGIIMSVAIGEAPARPCVGKQTLIRWNAQGPPGPPGPSGVSEAFATNHGGVYFTPDEPQAQDVLVLDLPKGNFISNLTLQGSYRGDSGSGFMSCGFDKIVDGDRSPLGGWLVGGGLEGGDFARTFDFYLYDENGGQVVVYCEPRFFDEPDGPIVLHWADWTVIKVDTIHKQPWSTSD